MDAIQDRLTFLPALQRGCFVSSPSDTIGRVRFDRAKLPWLRWRRELYFGGLRRHCDEAHRPDLRVEPQTGVIILVGRPSRSYAGFADLLNYCRARDVVLGRKLAFVDQKWAEIGRFVVEQGAGFRRRMTNLQVGRKLGTGGRD